MPAAEEQTSEMSGVMDVRKPAASTGPFAPLRNVTFRAIWLAGLISGLGWLIQTIAMSWLMATITPSSVMVALVQAATNLPAFILSIFAGAIVDNFNRRKVMLAARSLMTLTAVALTILVALGMINPWVILFFSFLAGCGIAFNDPAWQASVGDIVDRKDLAAAVTLTSVGFNTVRSVGPALGGIILATFGPLTAFCLYTLGHLAPLAVVWRSRWKVPTSRLPPEAMLTAISDGIRFTSLSSEIKTALGRGFLFGFAGIAILALLPLVVRDQLKQGAIAYGTLMAGFGAGALEPKSTSLVSEVRRANPMSDVLVTLTKAIGGNVPLDAPQPVTFFPPGGSSAVRLDLTFRMDPAVGAVRDADHQRALALGQTVTLARGDEVLVDAVSIQTFVYIQTEAVMAFLRRNDIGVANHALTPKPSIRLRAGCGPSRDGGGRSGRSRAMAVSLRFQGGARLRDRVVSPGPTMTPSPRSDQSPIADG